MKAASTVCRETDLVAVFMSKHIEGSFRLFIRSAILKSWRGVRAESPCPLDDFESTVRNHLHAKGFGIWNQRHLAQTLSLQKYGTFVEGFW